MITFIASIVILILGYFIYGKFVEKIFGADQKRATPATTMQDGVDYVPLLLWDQESSFGGARTQKL